MNRKFVASIVLPIAALLVLLAWSLTHESSNRDASRSEPRTTESRMPIVKAEPPPQTALDRARERLLRDAGKQPEKTETGRLYGTVRAPDGESLGFPTSVTLVGLDGTFGRARVHSDGT